MRAIILWFLVVVLLSVALLLSIVNDLTGAAVYGILALIPLYHISKDNKLGRTK